MQTIRVLGVRGLKDDIYRIDSEIESRVDFTTWLSVFLPLILNNGRT